MGTPAPSGGRPHEWGTAPDFVGPRHRLREALLLRELLARRPGRRVLDVGAGGGSLARLLGDRGFAVAATDASPAAVDVLRARGVDAARADATALPFAGEAFDAVVLAEVLEHVEGHEMALAEAHRVVVPGGVLAVSVPRNPAWFGSSDRWAGHVRRYTRRHLLGVVADAGFVSVRCRPWGFPVSTLYHRFVYEPRLARRGPAPATPAQRPALALLAVALRVDRLFVGVERGALGYLLTAAKPTTSHSSGAPR